MDDSSDELITLQVKDECGQIKEDSAFLKITSNDLLAELNSFGQTEFCENELIDFDYNLINFFGEITASKWDFGSGKSYGVDEFGPLQIEFLTSGEKEIHLQIETNANCLFGIDTTFSIMVNDCSDELTAGTVDYKLVGVNNQSSSDQDSLTTGGPSFLNQDFLISTSGIVPVTLTFPILEVEENKFHNLLIIYNNLGQIVFEKKAYQNDWEGQHQNGQRLMSGTYFYNLSFGQDKQYFQSGKIVYTR